MESTNTTRIVLEQLQGNDEPTLTALQTAMTPHLSEIISLYWIVWILTLATVIIRFLILPALKQKKGKSVKK